MPNIERFKSNRERLESRLKGRRPDEDYSDDEVLLGRVNDDYDDYDKQLSDYHARDKEMIDMFENHPSSASFFTEWRNGGDPIVLLIKKYGDDFKAALEDPERVDAIAQANKDYASRVAESEQYESAFAKNIDETTATIEQVQREDGLSDDQIDAAMGLLMTIMKDCLVGKVSAESIRMAVKAVNYEADVEEAEAVGEVRGRNAKIVEKLRKSGQGDGTSGLSSRGGGSSSSKPMPELGAIERYNGNSNIWERGGEKRKRINPN